MIRLQIEVEGPTEESFVNDVLVWHLSSRGYTEVSARLMGKARQRMRRGGVRPWPEVRSEILNRIRNDSEAIVSMMVDYYGMPDDGGGAWPGRAGATAELHFPNKVEESLLTDVSSHMGDNFNPKRFIPYVMMHEYEAILFSDCAVFADAIGYPSLASRFQAIRNMFNTPEDINDSTVTAPSKRIEELIPRYRKPIHGVQAATAIGLPAVRAECGHFRTWLEHLEDLAIRRAP